MKAFFTVILGLFAFYFITNLIANTDILYLIIQIAVYSVVVIILLHVLYYIGLGVIMITMFIMDVFCIPCSKKLKSIVTFKSKAGFNNKYNPFSKN